MNVELTQQAEVLAIAASVWWQKNRLSAPMLFDRELAEALEMLGSLPNVGTPYLPRSRYRRLLLKATGYHIYYRVDEAARVVYVVSVWHTSRGRSPRL